MRYLSLILTSCFVFFIFPKTVFASISFTISNPTIEGDYFIVDASLSGIASTSAFVQGMFTSTSSSSYFGFTWGQNEEWVNYVGSTNKDFITQNFPILQKGVSQKIWIKPNYKDKAYKGPGEYFLKLKRYTGASDNSTGDDTCLTVSLTEPLPTPTSTPTEEPTNTPEPTSAWTPNPTKTPTPTSKITPTKIPTLSITPSTSATSPAVLSATTSAEIASVSAVLSSPSATPSSTKSTPFSSKNFFFGGIFLAISSGSLLYFRQRRV